MAGETDKGSHKEIPAIKEDGDQGDGGKALEFSNVMQGEQIGQQQAKAEQKFQTPTTDDLGKQVNSQWDAYQKDQISRNGPTFEVNPSPEYPRGIQPVSDFVERRKAQDMKAIDALKPEDLKLIGDIASALQRNDVAGASKLITDSYDGAKYDYATVGNVDVGLRTELARRGIDKNWEAGFSYGPDNAHGFIQDKRTNLALNGGTEYVSYSVPIGKSDHKEGN